MMAATRAARGAGGSRRPIDLGRRLAQLLCAVFALVGGTPLLGELLLRSSPIQRWAANETARVLREQLGLSASYDVHVRLLPLRLQLSSLVVPATDGKGPALTADSISVTPRIFSLMAGRLDVGDIEIEAPRARLVVRDGKLTNVAYRLPKSKSKGHKLKHSPFSSLAVTDASIDLDLGDVKVRSEPADVDVFAGRDLSFDVALRAGTTRVFRKRPLLIPRPPPDAKPPVPSLPDPPAFDEDVICRTDLRVQLSSQGALIRRLSLLGLADADPGRGNVLDCERAAQDDPQRVALRLSQVRVSKSATGGGVVVDGHVTARSPLDVVNRFARTLPVQGWAGVSGDLHFESGRGLPRFHGKIRGAGIGFDVYHLAKELDASIDIQNDVVSIPHYHMVFADGDVVLTNAHIQPLAPGVPLHVDRVEGDGMKFQALMRDLGVTPNTIVQWDLHKTHVTNVRGHIVPLKIDADMTAETRDFEVFDRAFHDPARHHMIGVHAANIRCRLGVRPNAFEIYDARVRFGSSTMLAALVSIGFHNELKISVPPKGSHLDLSDISPLVNIPMAGKADIDVKLDGLANDPLLLGNMSVKGFEFGGFSFGDVHRSKVRFRPLWLEITDVAATKGHTDYQVSSGKLDFDSDATVKADLAVSSAALDVRDFLSMWHFDDDPRFDQVKGVGKVQARVHYALGGHEDRCGDGALRVDGSLSLARAELFEERYDGGDADFHFDWPDRKASYMGFDLDVTSLTLKKGRGTLLGSIGVHRGGKMYGHLVGTAVPISRIDAMSSWAYGVDGQVSAVAEIGGTVDQMEVDTDVRVSPVTIGASTLPASHFSVKLVPSGHAVDVVGKSRCGNSITAPFDRAEYDADHVQGVFHSRGELFGGQIRFDDFQTTRQRHKTVRGKLEFNALDLGAMAQLYPPIALSDQRPTGKLTATVNVESLPLDHFSRGKATATISNLEIEREGLRLALIPGAKPLVMADRKLRVPRMGLALTTPGGQRGVFDLSGSVANLDKTPNLDATLELRPTDLSALASTIPRIQRAQGTFGGKLRVHGPLATLDYSGSFELSNGSLALRGVSAPITDLNVGFAIDSGEVRIAHGSAKFGGGTLTLGGSAPLRGLEIGGARATLTARNVNLPMVDGVESVVDADLVATWQPNSESNERNLPELSGDVTIRSLSYTRPLTISADIESLAQRGKRTDFEAYDPNEDTLALDLVIRSSAPLKIRNNLVDAELNLGPEGLALTGTNQRFGLRGLVRLKPGGRIRLRRNEFEIREGFVRFDDATRIAPEVDVTAVTEYKRYSDIGSTGSSSGSSSSSSSSSSSTSSSTSASGGRWLITMHAHGDADKLRIDLASEPTLSQDDIFLLLTVGLTRAELDQARSASVGESVALEALGTLTGADRAVTDAVPVIDEFRFGSAYSSRAGRTEPTITIGKRLADRIRASVTSGVAESREVRSNVEWRLNPHVSVEGSYDNVNDISSSSLGNLGADVRWRLEF